MLHQFSSFTLTQPAVNQLIKTYQKNWTKKEIATVLTMDEHNTSTGWYEIQGQKGSAKQVQFSNKDLLDTLSDNHVSHTKWVLFHNHIQGQGHANVHSHQDELTHQQNNTTYSNTHFDYQGSGLFSINSSGNFHIKFKKAHSDELASILYDWIQAQEIVVNDTGNIIWYNKTSTLHPHENTSHSWWYTGI